MMTAWYDVGITRNDMTNTGMELRSWYGTQSLSIPLNWIKRKYTFVVTFKCKVKEGGALAHIVVGLTLHRAVVPEDTRVYGTPHHQLSKWRHRSVLDLYIHWWDGNGTPTTKESVSVGGASTRTPHKAHDASVRHTCLTGNADPMKTPFPSRQGRGGPRRMNPLGPCECGKYYGRAERESEGSEAGQGPVS